MKDMYAVLSLLYTLLVAIEQNGEYVQSVEATLFSRPMTWNDANQACIDMGQHLLTIDSLGKNGLIERAYNYLDVDEFWIGLHADSGNTGNYKWSDDCSAPTYENWSTSKDDSGNNFCTYVVATDMKWMLATCNTNQKPFICESQRSICTSGFSYQKYNSKEGLATKGVTRYDSVSTTDCENYCDSIAATSFCWGFVYNAGDQRCRLYDIDDKPYYNDDHQKNDHKSLHIRRCNYAFSRDDDLISVAYDSCGKEVVSQCSVFPCIETTTEKGQSTAKTTQQHSETTVQTSTISQSETTDQISTIFQSETTDQSSTTTRPETTSPITAVSQSETSDQSSTTPQSETTEQSSTTTTQSDTTNPITTIPQSERSDQSSTPSQTSVAGLGIGMVTTGNGYCKWTCHNVTTTLSLEESLKEIKDYLTIDKTKTSASIRRRTCAKDDRPSSTSIGYGGILILAVIFGVLIFTDFHKIYVHVTENRN